MPRYEYECPKCNAVCEVSCPIAERDAQVLACPANCVETGERGTPVPVIMTRRPTAPSPSFPGAASWRGK